MSEWVLHREGCDGWASSIYVPVHVECVVDQLRTTVRSVASNLRQFGDKVGWAEIDTAPAAGGNGVATDIAGRRNDASCPAHVGNEGVAKISASDTAVPCRKQQQVPDLLNVRGVCGEKLLELALCQGTLISTNPRGDGAVAQPQRCGRPRSRGVLRCIFGLDQGEGPAFPLPTGLQSALALHHDSSSGKVPVLQEHILASSRLTLLEGAGPIGRVASRLPCVLLLLVCEVGAWAANGQHRGGVERAEDCHQGSRCESSS
mmetsp:Transcript_22659/g.49772  ORF Transcript_22659/g.49772 Transcript_22659/m.49772 type:complete len:260 (-) Transcript_22659:160-939(-)